jgi:carbamoyl-phosphate synthase small subunit
MADAYVATEGGAVLAGRARAPGRAGGELVFTTAPAGYEESLTDPSYEGQVLTFAYPLVGNYGVREARFESDRPHPTAALAREFTDEVAAWLRSEGVPAVDNVDTRDVVTTVREGGAVRCGVAAGPDATPEAAREALSRTPEMSDREAMPERVGVDAVRRRGDPGGPTVALLDCGAKASIVDSLVERGADVRLVPATATPERVRALDPDLLFVSNGPGDPAVFERAREVVEHSLGEVPVAGICLGQQVVTLAAGGDTEKMEFGHRGVNQPVLDRESGRVVMTTQNHGYTVADPGDLAVTQVNVNDDTPEGLADEDLDVLTRQYHPEANPGPRDTLGFFDDVLGMVPESPVAAD